MKTHSFEIKGHQYTCTPHDGIDGQPLFFELLAMGCEPLFKLLANANAEEGLQVQALAASASDVSASLRRLAAHPELFRALFKHTTRNGVALSGDGAFRAAYAANWAEQILAARQIVEINGFVAFIKDLLSSDESQ